MLIKIQNNMKIKYIDDFFKIYYLSHLTAFSEHYFFLNSLYTYHIQTIGKIDKPFIDFSQNKVISCLSCWFEIIIY